MSVLMCYHSDLATFQPSLHSFVKSRVNNESDAEDVIQNANQVLINKEDQYDASFPFKSWAFGIAKWQVLAYYKKEKRSIPLLSLDVSEELNPNWLSDVPFSVLIKKERLELIKKLDHILSNRQKQVFNLLIEGFSQKEICHITGLCEKNVQVLKTRLIERIRNFVSKNKNENYHNY